MHWFDVCIVVLIAIFVLMVLACVVDFYILTWRYKKFYETTEEGRKLYSALYTKDRLGSKHDRLVNRMSELRDKIDEYEYYFPDERNEKDFIREMKVQYKEYSAGLYRTKEAMKNWSERIDEMVAALPKKYSDILEYNWANAKVEAKEENICW
nr:MAG TPA: reticulocyte binding/rhoptry protein [Caudoviricetes sp.]